MAHSHRVDSNSVIKSCCDVAMKGCSYFSTSTRHSGVYKITDCCASGLVTQGYCDTVTDGGGWLVVQRRLQGVNEDFHRFWTEYESGFGSLGSEFWYGLKPLNCLTSNGTWELRIDLTFANNTRSYLHYNNFKVGPATNNYRLNISGFTGITPTDPFTAYSINGQQFTTYDRDNDMWSGNCALNGHGDESGGWWHSSCNYINLNYNYELAGGSYGFIQLGYKWYYPKFIEMKIRPVICKT